MRQERRIQSLMHIPLFIDCFTYKQSHTPLVVTN
jgi:hypothetical protein